MAKYRKATIGASFLAFLAAAALAEAPMNDLTKLLTTPLKDKDAAVMFLSFSGVLVRTSVGTFAIDPANLLVDADIALLKAHGLKAVLYTHGHGDHLDAATAKAIVLETGAVIVAEPAVAAALKAAGGIPEDKLVRERLFVGRDRLIIDLPGEARRVKEVVFRYRKLNNAVRRSVVELWGK